MQGWQPKSDDQESGKKIYLCLGCSEELGFAPKKYCAYCSTTEGRKRMKDENNVIRVSIRVSRGLTPIL